MEEINTNKWQTFKVEEIFEVLTIKQKLSKKDISNGKTPVYSSETSNNGILGYTNKNPEFKVEKDCPFYLVFGDHTKAMHIADTSFCVMDNVKVLKPKNFNKNAILFIATVWQKRIPNLGYARHWSVAQNCGIVLPVTSDKKPDFAHMDEYMKDILENTEKDIENLSYFTK